MPVVARIVFSGICTIVAANAQQNFTPAAVVFPDATVQDGDMPPHHTYLIVSADHDIEVTPQPVRPLPAKRSPATGKQYWFVPVDSSYISMVNAVREKKLVRDDQINDGFGVPQQVKGNAPAEGEFNLLHWVPNMQQVWRKFGPGEHECLPAFASPDVAGGHVDARMDIPYGHLQSTWVSGDVWEFKPRSFVFGPYVQSLAQEVTLTVTLDDNDGLVLVSQPFDEQLPSTRYRIKPRAVEDIEVMLANVPDDDIVPRGVPAFCERAAMACSNDNDSDVHFHRYYTMFANPPQMEDQPIPVRRERQPSAYVDAMRVGGANCGPTQYP